MNAIVPFSNTPSLTMSSREIAALIGKQHSNIKISAERLAASGVIGTLAMQEFIHNGNAYTEYLLNKRDSLILVAQNCPEFTAAIVDRWQELEEKELSLQRKRSSVEWQKTRSDGKGVRFEFTGIVQEFVEYAKAQGSQSAQKYYMQLSKMENQALFMIDKAVGDGFRDRLETSQLIVLAMAEIVAQRALREGMNEGWHYKEIYQHAKKEVEKVAAVTGKSIPGQTLFPGSRASKARLQGASHA